MESKDIMLERPFESLILHILDKKEKKDTYPRSHGQGSKMGLLTSFISSYIQQVLIKSSLSKVLGNLGQSQVDKDPPLTGVSNM